jgi:hypothetical protein
VGSRYVGLVVVVVVAFGKSMRKESLHMILVSFFRRPPGP